MRNPIRLIALAAVLGSIFLPGVAAAGDQTTQKAVFYVQ